MIIFLVSLQYFNFHNVFSQIIKKKKKKKKKKKIKHWICKILSHVENTKNTLRKNKNDKRKKVQEKKKAKVQEILTKT